MWHLVLIFCKDVYLLGNDSPNLGLENLSHLVHLVYNFCVQDASEPWGIYNFDEHFINKPNY